MTKVVLSNNVEDLLKSIDFDSLGSKVGIKVHFGEKGCTTYMDPKIVKAVYDRVVLLGKDCSLIETNVLYRGSRTNSTDHIKTAHEHGFTFAPIDILDGELGDESLEVEVGLLKPAFLGKGLSKYDSLIVISHFKGHIAAGFGGALKNLGMGFGSRAGKLHMHSHVGPYVGAGCVGCKLCVTGCDFDAIAMIDGVAVINSDKCVGCAMCIAVCPHGVIQIPWGSNTAEELQRRIAYYAKGVLKIVSDVRFVNIMQKITSECDCMGKPQEPIMDDIGFTYSKDSVAIDQACLDLVNKKSEGKFDKINFIDNFKQIDLAEEIGIGKKEYNLEQL